jgi:Tfp pilus assembly protein PilO
MSWRRALALAVPPLLVVAGVWMLLWAPRSRQLADQEGRVAELETQQQMLVRRLDRALEFQQDDGTAALTAARAALPAEVDLGGFVTEHQEMARSVGVDVLSVAPVPLDVDGGSGLGEVEVSMSVLGERARVVDYVQSLTELSRLTEVSDVTLTTEGDGRTSAEVTALVYHRPD